MLFLGKVRWAFFLFGMVELKRGGGGEGRGAVDMGGCGRV